MIVYPNDGGKNNGGESDFYVMIDVY
jgi:hypothetical protein